MKRYLSLLILFTVAFTGCETLNSIPTNTTLGLFSLNGTWKLTSTTDGRALVGTTMVVYPVAGNATVKTAANNTYCIREKDELWKDIRSNGAGGFSITALVTACNGTTVYKDATISVVDNNKITVTSRTASNAELVQSWERQK